ncbi:APC family permease [Raineyella sp. LH-20]|uniref:APC family permease n=1 Tax=Raineyella sp. LH-20 TaxID=3081204 RepID=UPI002955C2DE|nr:APC family permease [Raineyella sp. LH-20]WOP19336.1 APC family permease [Raineyella sp. LH-20]
MRTLHDEIASPTPAPQFGTSSPLAGLRRRSLRPVDALAGSIAAAAPTAAGLTLPPLLLQHTGVRAWIAVLLAAGLALSMALLVGVFARRLTGSGALYTFVAQSVDTVRASGRAMALATAAFLTVAYGLVAVTALAGTGLYLARLPGSFGLMVPSLVPVGAAVVAGLACLGLLVRRISLSSRVMLALEAGALVVLLVPVLGVLLGDWGHAAVSGAAATGGAATGAAGFGDPAVSGVPVPAASGAGVAGADVAGAGTVVGSIFPHLGGLAAGVMITMAAFIGFDHAAFVGAETRRPLRTIPRVLSTSVVVVAVVQLLTVTAAIRAGSSAVFQATGMWWTPVLSLAGVLGFAACALASMTALSRLFLVLAKDGILPAGVGRTTDQGSPVTAVLVTALPIIGVTAGAVAVAGPWVVVSTATSAAASAYVLAYLLTAVAVPLFLRRIGELTLMPMVGAVGAAVGLAAVWLGFVAGPGQETDRWGAWIGVILPVVLVLAGWEVVRRRPPGRWGRYDVPTTRDVLGGDGARDVHGVSDVPGVRGVRDVRSGADGPDA